MGTEIDFHDIILFQDPCVAWVRRVVSRATVDAATCGEGNTGLSFIGFNQPSISVLNLIADVDELHAWLNNGLRVFSDLPVGLGTLTESLIVMGEESLFLPVFCFSCALPMLILVLKDLTLWVFAIGELLSNRDHWRV